MADIQVSPNYGDLRLMLNNVPGRSGIEVHSANTPDELLGCIAPGLSAGDNRVNQSRAAMADLLGLVQAQMVNDMAMGLGPDLIMVNVQ